MEGDELRDFMSEIRAESYELKQMFEDETEGEDYVAMRKEKAFRVGRMEGYIEMAEAVLTAFFDVEFAPELTDAFRESIVREWKERQERERGKEA